MKFLMLVATDTEPDQRPEAPGEIDDWLSAAGDKRILGERLRPKQDAKTVRVRDGKLLVTDGPFAQAKEAIVGFDILECESLEDAIALAAKHPMARAGRLELRAFWPFD
jgi:hypothetical protein